MTYTLADLQVEKNAIGKLRQHGIDSPSDLLANAGHPQRRQELARLTGTSEDLLLSWACRADLLRLAGVGPSVAALLGGLDVVHAMQDLAVLNPRALRNELVAKNTEQRLLLRPPSLKRVQTWVAEAGRLPAKVGHTLKSSPIHAEVAEASNREKRLTVRVSLAAFAAIAAALIVLYLPAMTIIHFSNVADTTGWDELSLLVYRYLHRLLRSMYLEGLVAVLVVLMAFAMLLVGETFWYNRFSERLDTWLLASRAERTSFLIAKQAQYERRGYVWAGLGLFLAGTLVASLISLGVSGDINLKLQWWISSVVIVSVVSSLVVVVPIGYGVIRAVQRGLRAAQSPIRKLILSYAVRIVYLVIITTATFFLLPPLLVKGIYKLDETVFLPHRTAICAEFNSEVETWANERGYPMPRDPCPNIFFQHFFHEFLPDRTEWLAAVSGFMRNLLPSVYVAACVGLILMPLLATERIKAAVLVLFALASYGLGELIETYMPRMYLLDRTSVSTIVLVIFFVVVTELSLDLLYQSAVEESNLCVFCSASVSVSDRYCCHCGCFLEVQDVLTSSMARQ